MDFPNTGRDLRGRYRDRRRTRASTRWFLAEGATGPFFECFVLVSNPGRSRRLTFRFRCQRAPR